MFNINLIVELINTYYIIINMLKHYLRTQNHKNVTIYKIYAVLLFFNYLLLYNYLLIINNIVFIFNVHLN